MVLDLTCRQRSRDEAVVALRFRTASAGDDAALEVGVAGDIDGVSAAADRALALGTVFVETWPRARTWQTRTSENGSGECIRTPKSDRNLNFVFLLKPTKTHLNLENQTNQRNRKYNNEKRIICN